jgi:threonyl-tRNA synthetase
VATITDEANSYAEEVRAACEAAGLRARVDLSNEKINYKVREHSLAKVPALLVVGKREAENKTVAIRRLGAKDQEILELGQAVARLTAEARPPSEAAGPAATN